MKHARLSKLAKYESLFSKENNKDLEKQYGYYIKKPWHVRQECTWGIIPEFNTDFAINENIRKRRVFKDDESLDLSEEAFDDRPKVDYVKAKVQFVKELDNE